MFARDLQMSWFGQMKNTHTICLQRLPNVTKWSDAKTYKLNMFHTDLKMLQDILKQKHTNRS